MTRRWCKALSGLWERRDNPVVWDIVSEALHAAEWCVSVRDAIEHAINTGQETEVFVYDQDGRPTIVHVRPVMRGGNVEILTHARPARYRLHQARPQVVSG